jgi:hypothetical protein
MRPDGNTVKNDRERLRTLYRHRGLVILLFGPLSNSMTAKPGGETPAEQNRSRFRPYLCTEMRADRAARQLSHFYRIEQES